MPPRYETAMMAIFKNAIETHAIQPEDARAPPHNSTHKSYVHAFRRMIIGLGWLPIGRGRGGGRGPGNGAGINVNIGVLNVNHNEVNVLVVQGAAWREDDSDGDGEFDRLPDELDSELEESETDNDEEDHGDDDGEDEMEIDQEEVAGMNDDLRRLPKGVDEDDGAGDGGGDGVGEDDGAGEGGRDGVDQDDGAEEGGGGGLRGDGVGGEEVGGQGAGDGGGEGVRGRDAADGADDDDGAGDGLAEHTVGGDGDEVREEEVGRQGAGEAGGNPHDIEERRKLKGSDHDDGFPGDVGGAPLFGDMPHDVEDDLLFDDMPPDMPDSNRRRPETASPETSRRPEDNDMLMPLDSDHEDPLPPAAYTKLHNLFLTANMNHGNTFESQRIAVNEEAVAAGMPHLIILPLTMQQQQLVHVPPPRKPRTKLAYASIYDVLMLPEAIPLLDTLQSLSSGTKLPNLRNLNVSVLSCLDLDLEAEVDKEDAGDGPSCREWAPMPEVIIKYCHRLNVFRQQGWLVEHYNQWKVPNVSNRWEIPLAALVEVNGNGSPGALDVKKPFNEVNGARDIKKPLNLGPIRNISWRLMDLISSEVGSEDVRQRDNRKIKPKGPLGLGWGIMFLLPMISRIGLLEVGEWVRLVDGARTDKRWWKLKAFCEALEWVWEGWAEDAAMDDYFRARSRGLSTPGVKVQRWTVEQLHGVFFDFLKEEDDVDMLDV